MCGENSDFHDIFTTCGDNLSVHPLSTELLELYIKILDEATVSRLIFVCSSPKSRSHESEICGENLSVCPYGVCSSLSVHPFVVKICSENVVKCSENVVKGCHENFM